MGECQKVEGVYSLREMEVSAVSPSVKPHILLESELTQGLLLVP